MKYMGSKNKIAKHILPIILKDRKENQYYVEPFVGGANMIDKVEGLRIGADFNKYTIQGLISIRDYIEELPKTKDEFTEEMYKELRKSDEYKHKGYASYQLSFGNKFMGGYAKNKVGFDYVKSGYNNALKQNPLLQGVELINCKYTELKIPPRSIIYCDPPYEGTTKYSNVFDHNEFWEWCREKSKEGHQVFISEYNAPEDFECIWSLEVTSTLNKNSKDKKVEKLFKYKGLK